MGICVAYNSRCFIVKKYNYSVQPPSSFYVKHYSITLPLGFPKIHNSSRSGSYTLCSITKSSFWFTVPTSFTVQETSITNQLLNLASTYNNIIHCCLAQSPAAAAWWLEHSLTRANTSHICREKQGKPLGGANFWKSITAIAAVVLNNIHNAVSVFPHFGSIE